MKKNNDNLTAMQIVAAALAGATVLFDIDGVLLDATHRQNCNADGTLNLDKYRENSTPELIAKDSELSLMGAARQLDKLGLPYHIATARIYCKYTAKLLRSKGINPRSVIHRVDNNDTRKDADLKRSGIIASFPRSQFHKLLLVDDSRANIQMANDLGINTMHIDFEGH